MDQFIGDGVEMLLELNVVINIHPSGFPGGIFIRGFRQRVECRLVQLLE
jgi:hypothetical protein